MTCPTCNGVGLIRGTRQHPLVAWGHIINTSRQCPDCKGTGKVETEPLQKRLL